MRDPQPLRTIRPTAYLARPTLPLPRSPRIVRGLFYKGGLRLVVQRYATPRSDGRNQSPRRNGMPVCGHEQTTIAEEARGTLKGRCLRSTLRRSVGCLLAERLGIELEVTRVSRLTHCHFGFGSSGELSLSNWMRENARVSWVRHDEPLFLERHLIKTLTLPLNVKGNNHPFAKEIGSLLRSHEERALSRLR